MIVLDANIVIALLDSENSSHIRSQRLLETHAGEQWAVCTLTLAEILVGPARAGRLAEARSVIGQLNIRVEAIGADAAGAIADLRAATSLKMPDCCVLYTAELFGCGLATFDRRLGAEARGRGTVVFD